MDAQGNSEANSGYGSGLFLKVADDPWIELDEVTEIPFSEEVADDFEVSHFKSPGKRKEYRTGMTEPGEGSLTVNYIPGSKTDLALKKARDTGAVCAYESYVPAPEGKWMKTAGYLIVKSRSKAVPINDRMTQTVNVRFTGLAAEAVEDEQREIA